MVPGAAVPGMQLMGLERCVRPDNNDLGLKRSPFMKFIKVFIVIIFLNSGVSDVRIFNTSSVLNVMVQAQTPAEIRSSTRGIATTNDVDFSPDGSKIATYTKEEFIAIWEVETGELIQSLPGQEGYISELDWSPNGKLLASASNNGTGVIWNIENGERIQTLGNFGTGEGRPFSGANEIEFSPDGRFIAAMRYEPTGLIVVWRLENGEEMLRIEREVNTYDFGWSGDGKIIFTLDGDGFLNSWSIPDGNDIRSVRLDDQRLVDLDGATQGIIAAGGTGDAVFVYDSIEDTLIQRFEQGSFVNRTAVATDIDRVASAGSDGYLYYWNLKSGELIYRRFAHNPIHYYVTFSPNRKYLATSGSDNNLRLWDAESGDLVREISGD